MNKDISVWIIIFTMGILMFLCIPINQKIKDDESFLKTTGELISVEKYSDSNIKYRLEYKYLVNEYVYFYTVDSYEIMKPKIGYEIEIKYDQENPEECYSDKYPGFEILKIAGTILILISLLFSPLTKIIWLKDFLYILIPSIFVILIIQNKIYYDGYWMLLLLILSVLIILNSIELMLFFKDNNITLIKDLKKIYEEHMYTDFVSNSKFSVILTAIILIGVIIFSTLLYFSKTFMAFPIFKICFIYFSVILIISILGCVIFSKTLYNNSKDE